MAAPVHRVIEAHLGTRQVARVIYGAIFFVLAAAGVLEAETAFTIAKWSGLGLISLYGFLAGRLAGAGLGVSVLEALAVRRHRRRDDRVQGADQPSHCAHGPLSDHGGS